MFIVWAAAGHCDHRTSTQFRFGIKYFVDQRSHFVEVTLVHRLAARVQGISINCSQTERQIDRKDAFDHAGFCPHNTLAGDHLHSGAKPFLDRLNVIKGEPVFGRRGFC
jgi:hypothetical protein